MGGYSWGSVVFSRMENMLERIGEFWDAIWEYIINIIEGPEDD